MNFLITIRQPHRYLGRTMVCCVLRKGVRWMRKILEDFYFGNITPSEREMKTNSNLHRVVNRAARCEGQLTERIGGAEQVLLSALVKAQREIDSITALENFILGFRLGIRMMAECMDNNDGEIREVTDYG